MSLFVAIFHSSSCSEADWYLFAQAWRLHARYEQADWEAWR